MNFNQHLTLEGQHAFLGASKYHWINYDSDKLATAYKVLSYSARNRIACVRFEVCKTWDHIAKVKGGNQEIGLL